MSLGAMWSRVKNVCQQNGLLILSVLAVVIGCLLGFFLRSKHLSEQVGRLYKSYVSFDLGTFVKAECVFLKKKKITRKELHWSTTAPRHENRD